MPGRKRVNAWATEPLGRLFVKHHKLLTMRHVILSIALTCISFVAAAQQSSLRGKITNASSQPIGGAVIVFDGTNYGALSEDDGGYVISQFPPGTYTVVVSAPGYQTLRKDLYIDAAMEFAPQLAQAVTGGPEQPPLLPPNNELVKLIAVPEVGVYAVGNVPETGVFAAKSLSPDDLRPLDNGQDLPYLLRFTPSVVTTSDAGAGIGYTGLRIRGSDQSRINVTINGIPYNDPESHGVFWVNLPDFAGSAENISIQRGVGSSTNGAGAFGATLGITTTGNMDEPSAEISNTYGSFNTFRHRVAFNTGRMENGLAMEGRLSQITSDGFVDRASSELRSYYMSGDYDGGTFQIKGLVFGGKERTYQAWWGVPEVALNGTADEIAAWGVNNFYAPQQINDLVNLRERANYYTYENEVDDYAQDHYQLHFSTQLGKGFALQAAGHYTYGRGFFEQFRDGDNLADYGIDNTVIGAVQQFADGVNADGDPINAGFENSYNWDALEISHNPVTDANGNVITNANGDVLLNSLAQIAQSDIIRRRWLENDFYGATYGLTYDKKLGNNLLNVIFGGAWNQYDGDHFGEIIWMEHANQVQYQDFYYVNNGLKTDFNNYLKVNYTINNKISVYGDLQMRDVTYRVRGIDQDRLSANVDDTLRFINPKFGVSAWITENDQIYASYAIGNREPTRSDYLDAPTGREPRPENLRDTEFGYRRITPKYTVGVNFYNMNYTDQLVLTGELNDVGSPIRTNVASSYRRGVEVEMAWMPTPRVMLMGNATYSQNKINLFVEEVPAYDENFEFLGFQQNGFESTDISFSPGLIAGGIASYRFMDAKKHKADIAWQTKYVGEQFLDNTSNAARSMPAYLINDLRVTYTLLKTGMKALEINLLLNNVLDERFVNNGYTYAYLVGEQRIDENFYYPQAGRNFLASLTLRF